MYNCSSSVKALTPKNHKEQHYLGYQQQIIKYRNNIFWTAAMYSYYNWRFPNPKGMIQDNLESL
jgi:hypothetical protein